MVSGEGSTTRNFIVCTLHLIHSDSHVARMEEGRITFKILTGTPTGKRPLGKPRSRWEDNIRMNLKEIGIDLRNWVDSTQDSDYWRAVVNEALNLRVP